MARYAWGNTLAAFIRSTTGIAEATTVNTFDSNFVSNAISIAQDGLSFLQTMPFVDAASATTFWLHFERFQTGGYSTSGDSFNNLELLNSTGVVVVKIIRTGTNVFSLQRWNGATYTVIGTFTGTATGARSRYDLKVVCGASGEITLYESGAPSLTATGSFTDVNNIASVRWRSPGTPSATVSLISQVLAADYDTRDSRYYQQLANANGADTDGSGTYTDINEAVLDESTAINLPAIGNKKTFTKAAASLPGGYGINAMLVAARGRVSGGVVTDGKLVIRSGGADYDSGAKAFNGGYEPRGHYLDQDPATVAAWSVAGYNAAEFGAKAA